MSYLLIAAAFTVSPTASVSYTTAAPAANYLSERVQTGTLLLSRGDCLAVKVFARSRYTHVAAVVVTKGKAYVYESANGAGVRKKSLSKYLEDESPDTIYVLNPAAPFSKKRAETLKQHLEKEIGRPYGIKHHFTGKPAKGVHCSEYITHALQACKMIHAKRPSRVSPGSLAQGVLGSSLYETGVAVQIQPTEEEAAVGRNRCEQFWFDTKFCTVKFCRKCKSWLTCRR